MKNRKSKIIKICLMIVLVLSISLITIKVGADSGWDTSYGGGSSSSSSSWNSSGSDSSSSGSGLSINLPNWLALLIWAGIFFPLLTFGMISTIKDSIKNKKRQKAKQKKKEKEILELKSKMQDQIKIIDSNLDLNEFNNFIFNKFVCIQEDWMNFNYDGLRSNLSDELYNQYEMQLDTLKAKDEKNIMSNFKFIDCYIKKLSTNDNIQQLEVILEVSFRDYVVNKKNRVVRGNKKTTYTMTYKLTFIRNIDSKVCKCPKCGAEVDKNINKCPYCRVTIIKDSNEWVMSKKELLNQLNSTLNNSNKFIVLFFIILFVIMILMLLIALS